MLSGAGRDAKSVNVDTVPPMLHCTAQSSTVPVTVVGGGNYCNKCKKAEPNQ